MASLFFYFFFEGLITFLTERQYCIIAFDNLYQAWSARKQREIESDVTIISAFMHRKCAGVGAVFTSGSRVVGWWHFP